MTLPASSLSDEATGTARAPLPLDAEDGSLGGLGHPG